MRAGAFRRGIQLLEERPAFGIGVFALFYGVGVVGHLLDGVRPTMLLMTPFFLPTMGLLALATLLVTAGTPGRSRFWGWAGGTFLVTWALEVLGVHTGIVFGEYVYGRGLGAPVLGVPPLIGFNWVLVCLGMLIWVTAAEERWAARRVREGGEGRRLPRPILALAAAALAAGRPTPEGWLAVWLAEAVLALGIGGWAVKRKAARADLPVFTGAGRKFFLSFLPPAVAGAAITAALVRGGEFSLVPGIWLLLYGVAVVTGGAFSVKAIPLMGVGFMLLGGLALATAPHGGDLLLAVGFGGLHLLFGLHIARKHGG
jgi:hypothetical protein